MRKRVLFLFVLVVLVVRVSLAQNIDPATVNVSTLSEAQISKIRNEISSRGLTVDQAMILAKQRGASDTQISELKMRLSGASMGKSSNSSSSVAKNTSSSKHESANPKTMHQNENKLSHLASPEYSELEKIFGSSLFMSQDISFTPSNIVNASDDYIISEEDEFVIQIWGNAQATYQLEVNKSGALLIPDLGPVYVKGKTYKNAVVSIKRMLVGIYSGMKGNHPTIFADVSLSWQHDINVVVMGDAVAPGSYLLPANSTVFNALYASGGPNVNGSFRDVRVLRGNKVVANIDLYDFLARGTSVGDLQLRDNDVVYIPSYSCRVELQGAFRKPLKYELEKSETISDLLKYSGGFADNAYGSKVKIERIVEGQKSIEVVDKSQYASFSLQNGDKVLSEEVLNKYDNRVTIRGAVFRPGSYQLKSGMKLSSLIAEASGLRKDAYLQRGYLTRKRDNMELENISFDLKSILDGSDDVELVSEDVITIRSRYDMQEVQNVKIYGELNSPGEFPYVDNMTLQDLVVRAGGFSRDADVSFIEVARSLSNKEAEMLSDTISHYYSFGVDRDLKLSNEGARFVLKPFDVIYVRRAPGRRKFGSVKLLGEVLYAGDYSIISKKDHISDVVQRAGGTTPDAYLDGAMLIRKRSLSKIEVQRLERLSENKEIRVNTSKDQSEIVGISLKDILANPHGSKDILVEAGDVISIPKNIETVRISGNVMNPIAVVYKRGKRLKKYINKSGGFDVRSRRSKVYVVYPNGTTSVTKNFILFKKYPKIKPGSEIIVPRRPKKGDQTVKWIGIGSSLSTLAISIVSLINLTK